MDNFYVHNSRLFHSGTLVDLLLLQTATGDVHVLLLKTSTNFYKLLQRVTEVVTQSLHRSVFSGQLFKTVNSPVN